MANTLPAGVNQNIQFNNNGSFGANASFNFDTGTGTLYVDNLSVGPGVINAETRIVTGGDITPYTTGQNFGDVENRWYNMYLDGGIYASGSFGTQDQILMSDGYGTVRWMDPAQVALLAANSQSQIVDLLARFTANSNYANIHYLFGIEESQNTTLTNIQTSIQNVYAYANTIVGGGTSVDQAARNTANTAAANTIYIVGVNNTQNNNFLVLNTFANAAFDKANVANILAQAAFDKANTASSNTIYTQGVDTTQNTNISAADAKAQAAFNSANVITGVNATQNTNITAADAKAQAAFNSANVIAGVDTTQNTRITTVETRAQAAFDYANTIASSGTSIDQFARNVANTASSNTIYTQGVDVGQNTRMSIIEGVNTNQNTLITIIQGVDVGQNNRMSIIEGVDVTQNANITIIQGVDTTQNTRMSIIEGVDVGQNSRITVADTKAQAAFDYANTIIGSGTSIDQFARDKANTASSNTIYTQGVDDTQNTNIITANTKAQAAFDKANTAITVSGGIIDGDLEVTGNVTSDKVFANEYYGVFDGGGF